MSKLESMKQMANDHLQGDRSAFGTMLVSVIVLGVALLGDMMYLQLMRGKFPGGITFAFVIVGAVASFLSMGYLLLGKSTFFHPGVQMWAAWGLVVLDVGITALNIIDVFYGGVSGYLSFWDYLAPASPLFIMVGVIVVHFASPTHKMRHQEMIFHQKVAEIDRDFELTQKQVDMEVKQQALYMIRDMASQDLHSPESMAQLQGISSGFLASAMSNLSGYMLPNHADVKRMMTVESTPPKLAPASLKQADSVETPEEPVTQPLQGQGDEDAKKA